MKKLLAILLALVMVVGLVPAAFASDADVTADQATILSSWSSILYEPNTTVSLPATIVWPTDATAVVTAAQGTRPNTMLVSVDADLKVTAMDGTVLSDDLTAYLVATKVTTIPALYISDAATADAVSAYCTENSVNDIFVVASAENAALVNQVVEANLGVRGIIDWTDAGITTERASLHELVKATNKNFAKIAIIPEEIATKETVDYLRAMLISVWVATSPDNEAIYTQLTNGVNGVVCSSYLAVAKALESFNDVTTLLRVPFITGHRGLPSQYVENTIRSERGAIDAGCNVIECDISMSSDGVLFVLHDDDAKRLFNRPDVTNVEDLTIAELQAMPFDMTDDTVENAPNSVLNTNNTNRNTSRREDTVLDYDPEFDHIPTLEEYFTALNDENIFHFIEIKSYNPEIVPVFKELCERMGMTDRMCVITFNDGGAKEHDPAHDVMAEMRKTWPEMSLGYLGWDSGNCPWLPSVVAANGNIGEGVAALLNVLKPYNSTYNQFNSYMDRSVISAARHRGMTAWPWTYNTEEMFAKDYLGGIYSLTTNFTTWATYLPVELLADVDGTNVAATIIAQNGDVLEDVGKLSIVTISGPAVVMDEDGNVTKAKEDAEGGEVLCMLRLDLVLNINDFDLGDMDTNYAIYSNPFVLTVD